MSVEFEECEGSVKRSKVNRNLCEIIIFLLQFWCLECARCAKATHCVIIVIYQYWTPSHWLFVTLFYRPVLYITLWYIKILLTFIKNSRGVISLYMMSCQLRDIYFPPNFQF